MSRLSMKSFRNTPLLISPEFSIIQSQSLDIWEPVQPEEASQNGTDIPLGLGASRWIAVDIEDAGGDEERVLYRTFVNAGIGGKKFRIRTKGAPYMLLLATREGESEPKIILCNQSGSLRLERECWYQPVCRRYDFKC